MGDQAKPIGLLDCLQFAWMQTDDNSGPDRNIRARDAVLVGIRVATLSLPVMISIGTCSMFLSSANPSKYLGVFLSVVVSICFVVGLEIRAKRAQQLSDSVSMVIASMWALAGCAARSQCVGGLSQGLTFCAPQLAITMLRLPCRTSHAVLLAHIIADTAIAMAGASFVDVKGAAPSQGGEAVVVNVMANTVFFGMCLFESYSFEVTMKTAEKAQPDAGSTDGGGKSEPSLVDRLLIESCDCVLYTDASVTMNVLRATGTLEDIFGENVTGQPLVCRANGVKHSMKLVHYVKQLLGEVDGRTTPYMPSNACMELSFQHSSGSSFTTSLLPVWLPPNSEREACVRQACLAIGIKQKSQPQPVYTQAKTPVHGTIHGIESSLKKDPTQLPITPKAHRKTSFMMEHETLTETAVSSHSRPDSVIRESSKESMTSATPSPPASAVSSKAAAQQTRPEKSGSLASAESGQSKCESSKSGAQLAGPEASPQQPNPPISLPLAKTSPEGFQQEEGVMPQPGERQPSVGSKGHPQNCAPACKFVNGAKGCKDGDQCLRCHLCKWKKTRAKAEKKEEGHAAAPQPMTVSTPTFAKGSGDQYQQPQQFPPYFNGLGLPPHLLAARRSSEDMEGDAPSRIGSFVGTMVSGAGSSGVEMRTSGGSSPAYITLQDTGEFPVNTGVEDGGGQYRSLAQLSADSRVKKKNTFLHCDTSSIISTRNRICVSSMSDPGVGF